VVVRVTDRANLSDERPFDIAVTTTAPPLKITSSLPDGRVGGGYNAILTASGGAAPYKWEITSQLPPGLRLDSNTGVVQGTPSTAGRFAVAVRLSDRSTSATASMPVVIAPPIEIPEKKTDIPEKKKDGGGTVATAPLLCPANTPMTKEDAALDSSVQSGSVVWNGQVIAGSAGVVVIVGKQKRTGPGNVSQQSNQLTGAPIDFNPTGAQVLEPPSPRNGFRCIAFQPTATSVKIDWKVNWSVK
jgi:hypothetical protein